MTRKPGSQRIIDRINEMGLTVAPERLQEAIMERIHMIDEGIAGVLLAIVEFDNPDDPVHETGISVQETLNLYEERRNRLLAYLTGDLSDDTIDQPTLPFGDQPTQIIKPEQGKDEE